MWRRDNVYQNAVLQDSLVEVLDYRAPKMCRKPYRCSSMTRLYKLIRSCWLNSTLKLFQIIWNWGTKPLLQLKKVNSILLLNGFIFFNFNNDFILKKKKQKMGYFVKRVRVMLITENQEHNLRKRNASTKVQEL